MSSSPSTSSSEEQEEGWERTCKFVRDEENWIVGRASRTRVIGGLSADVGGAKSRDGEG